MLHLTSRDILTTLFCFFFEFDKYLHFKAEMNLKTEYIYL